MKTVVRAVLSRFEWACSNEPEIYHFLMGVLGEAGSDCAEAGRSEVDFNGRLVACIQELLPTFRRLRLKLMPWDAVTEPPLCDFKMPGEEHSGGVEKGQDSSFMKVFEASGQRAGARVAKRGITLVPSPCRS